MDNKRLSILLVEDNAADAQLIQRQIFKIADTTSIRLTANLDEVRTELNVFKPDIVISDYNLPAFTGMDVLETVREIAPRTLFVFVTGTLEDEEMAAETILAGADGFILKKNINDLHVRLRPYFEKAVKNSLVGGARSKIEQSADLVEKIQDYLKDISEENLSHVDRIEKIKSHLDLIKNKL